MDKTFNFEKKYECKLYVDWRSPDNLTSSVEAKVSTCDKSDDTTEEPEMGRWGHWETTSSGEQVWVEEEDYYEPDFESNESDNESPFDDDDIEWPRSGDSGWCTRLGALL